MDKYLINDHCSELLLKTNHWLPYRVIMISFAVLDYSLKMSLLTLMILYDSFKRLQSLKMKKQKSTLIFIWRHFAHDGAKTVQRLSMWVLLVSVQGIRHDMSSYQKLSEIFHIVSSSVQHSHGQIQTMYPQDNCDWIHHVLRGVIWSLNRIYLLIVLSAHTDSHFLVNKTLCNLKSK